MKVLFLTNLPSPYRVDFFNELGKLVELYVLYERKSSIARNEKWFSNNAKNFKEIYLKGISIGEESSICFEVIKYLQDSSFTHIVISGYGTATSKIAILWLTLNRISFIMNVDGGIIKETRGIKYLIKRFFISKADLYLSAGNNTTNYLVHYGACRDRCLIYPFTSLFQKDILGEPLTKLEKDIYREKLGMYEKHIVISVGSFIKRKGFDVLLNSIPKLKDDVGIYLIGGKMIDEYNKIIEEKQISNVYFIDFMDKRELIEYYYAADLFVLPTREDIWGLVINEAMAKGLPIITTTKCVAGVELITDYETGLLVPPDDPRELARAINMILDDAVLQANMSKNVLERIKSYTLENMAKVCYELLTRKD